MFCQRKCYSAIFVGVLLCASFSLYGQSATKTVAAAATQPQVEIAIPALGAGQQWAVVVQPVDGLQQFTVMPERVLSARPEIGSESGTEAVQPIVKGYSIGDSTFRLLPAGASGGSVLLDVHLPLGKAVIVSYGGKAVFRAVVAGPVLLINGTVDAKANLPLLRATTLLMLPSQEIANEIGPDLRAGYPANAPVASTAGLRRHLKALPPLATSLAGQSMGAANGNAATVVAKIHIDATGEVTDVQIERGGGPLAHAVQKALEGAVFTPFTRDGSPVAVSGIVQYTLTAGGKLLDVNIR